MNGTTETCAMTTSATASPAMTRRQPTNGTTKPTNKTPNKLFGVYCRFRPLNEREKNEENGEKITLVREDCTNTQVVVRQNTERRSPDLSFEFDAIHYENTSQTNFYNSLEEHVEKFVTANDDLNILTYGQTSSGKTWTVDGSFNKDSKIGDTASVETYGIMPRIVRRVYETHKPDQIRLAYYEIYCDLVYDLFRDDKPQKEAKFMEINGQIKIDLSTMTFASATDALHKLHARNAKRHFAETEMNKSSSRSHTFLEIACLWDNGSTRKTLRVIDLAGSERVAKTQVTNQTLIEGININSSLMYLKQMIEVLSTRNTRRSRAMPKFRESKLTRILHSSITTGRATIILILCCSPSAFNLNETLNTLRFGSTARAVEKPDVPRNDLSRRIDTEMRERVQRSEQQLEQMTEKMNAMRQTERDLLAELERLRKQQQNQDRLARETGEIMERTRANIAEQQSAVARRFDATSDDREEYEVKLAESTRQMERLTKTLKRQQMDIQESHDTLRDCKETIEMQQRIIAAITEDKQKLEKEIKFYQCFASYVQDWTREEEDTDEEYVEQVLRNENKLVYMNHEED